MPPSPYRSGAADAGLPFVTPPEAIDRSSRALEATHGTVPYTNLVGQTLPGRALVSSVTIMEAAAIPLGAEAFLRFPLSTGGREMLTARGFIPAAVPGELHGLIEGRYPR